MNVYSVQVYRWETPRLYGSDSLCEPGEYVVVETDFGMEIGTIVHRGTDEDPKPAKSILRLASRQDIENYEKNKQKEIEILEQCKQEARKLGLEMKLVDAHLTVDGSNVIVFFTADGRIDFRELVKSASRLFHRSVRMQQIGSREESRKVGGCGVCGRELCCVQFPGNLPSISTDMARVQQISHRGTSRISGQCGRLLCCLAYEAEQYKELMVGMPELHSTINIKEGKGEVIEINALRQEVKVRIGRDLYVIVPKKDLS